VINVFNDDTHLMTLLPEFVTAYECDHILRRSIQNLQPADVVSDDGKGRKHPGRTGSNTWLPHKTDSIIYGVSARLANAARMPLENAEDLQIVHYGVGQQYDYHFDSFDKDEDPAYNESYLKGGQRIMTVFGFLNDVPKGGETGFKRLGINIQPKRGTVVLWYNTKPGTNKREHLSEHAGLPVLEGQKYAFNLWFHENRYQEL